MDYFLGYIGRRQCPCFDHVVHIGFDFRNQKVHHVASENKPPAHRQFIYMF
jgi:hypothetical protein